MRWKKYIAFIPSNRTEEGEEKVPTKEFFEEWMAKIKDYLSEVKDENGNPVKVEIEYLTSDSKVHNDDENSKALKNFEDSSNVSGGIKVLVAINKLNEGVHVDGIDGSFMFRGIGQDSSTLFLQQSGRCISSMNPSKPFDKQSKTQIFDVSGNFLKQINNNTGKKVSRRYDLEKIQEISEWMNEQGRMPDANSEDLKEARYAIALRRLRDKYSIYLQSNLPSKDRDKIKEIIGIGTEMNLWEMNIPERTAYPNEEELTGARFLSMTDSQAKFMELYNKARSLGKQREEAASIRVTKLINILTILKNHNPELELPTGMMIEKETTQDSVNITLEEFLGNHFEQAEIEPILVELSDFDRLNATNKREIYHPGEVYDLGQELAFVRGKLWTSQQEYEKTGNNIFERYTAEELTRLDVIDGRHIKALEQELKELFGMESRDVHTSEGFIKCKEKTFKCSGQEYGPVEEIAGHSIHTGSVFIDGRDADGYDEQGYDELGFDRDGFDENGIHKITGERYDNRFFRKAETIDEQTGQKTFKWINMKTNSEYDLLGFNHEGFDKDGFERPAGLAQDDRGNIRYQARLWHKKREDGSYEKFGRRVNEKTGQDAHDFRYENGAVYGYYGRVGKQSTHNGFWSNGATQQHPDGKQDFYSYDGLDIDGFNKEGFKQITTPDGKTKYVHRNTSAEFNEYGKVYKRVENKKTGKYEMKVADHSSIVKTKGVLYLLTAKNMTLAQVYKQYVKECKCSLEEAEAQIRKALETSMRISTIATHAFDDYAQSFQNLNNSPEKAKQIRQFFAICPEAKQRIIQESRETQRRLERLDSEQKAIQQQSFEALREGNSQEFARLSAKFKEKENTNRTEKERLTKKAEILKHLDDFDER